MKRDRLRDVKVTIKDSGDNSKSIISDKPEYIVDNGKLVYRRPRKGDKIVER